MEGILTRDGSAAPATAEAVRQALGAGAFFWLDLDGVDDEVTDLLLHGFGFHPLAVEDAEHFGQRPKLDEYDGFTYLVAHGADPSGRTTDEVHIFFSPNAVVTVRRGACAALDDVRQRVGHHRATEVTAPQIALVYLIVDSLVDSYFPVLATFDDRIDALEDSILAKPTEAQLGTLFDMKRSLIAMRKVVTPQRDMFASLTSGVTEIPGLTTESDRYFRDLYDHLIRISDLVDSYRDLLSGVMDTHLSTVSNRLNVIMKQLTIIATIFLPLSFLTGFFGQNFAWMVLRITSFWAWLGFAVGLEVATALLLVAYFKRRGWLGGPTT